MDDREQQREIRHRLSVLRHAKEVSGNVAATSRYCGISRPTFYEWQNRFDELGPEGLRDRSRITATSPSSLSASSISAYHSRHCSLLSLTVCGNRPFGRLMCRNGATIPPMRGSPTRTSAS